jgi:succinate dehydrogenase / fumarate reductase cytochrome b subunit
MRQRPLSPHLQSYRLPGTALLSISHRITGVVLSFGTVFGVALLVALAFDQDGFERIRTAIATPVGQLALWLWLYAFLFHLCHGVRHLLWDIGWGFERERMTRYVVFELSASVLLLIGVFLTSQILT